MSSIRVQLQQFEGPLDLLLYLIRKEEMDIFNINIVEITKQYLDFIKLMKEFDLEVAGDFIAMASTLIQIKSKMLLPSYDENGEVVENIDPRKELVQKLLEYEKYKEASKALYDRPLLNRNVWARGLREKLEVTNDEIELEDNALFALISSYRKMVKTLHKKVHKVNVKLQSIASRILEMSAMLIPGSTVRMVELFRTDLTERIDRSRQALITFLSLLELGKMGYVGIYQSENYGDIHVQTKKMIEGDVVSKVEEYGTVNSENVADALFAKSNVLTEQELELLDQEDDVLAADANPQMSFEENLAAIAADVASDEELLAAELELESAEAKSAEPEAPSVDSASTEVQFSAETEEPAIIAEDSVAEASSEIEIEAAAANEVEAGSEAQSQIHGEHQEQTQTEAQDQHQEQTQVLDKDEAQAHTHASSEAPSESPNEIESENKFTFAAGTDFVKESESASEESASASELEPESKIETDSEVLPAEAPLLANDLPQEFIESEEKTTEAEHSDVSANPELEEQV